MRSNETIQDILAERKLNPKIFEFVPKLNAPISTHVNWIFGNIYSHHYPSSLDNKENRSEVARMHHGIQHVTRAAIYILVFANLYRLFKNEDALKLTDEDIKLLQIAALFHDAARLNDGVDYWDGQSGKMLYEYLIHLGVPVEKALLLANAVAHKDQYPPANIYQELLQNADCLDIKRVMKVFDANFLYFYKHIASENRTAFLLMAKLIMEVYGLIVQQGDYFEQQLDLIKKKQYENKDAYHQIMNDICSGYPDPLAKLYQNNENPILSNYPILKEMSQGLLDCSILKYLPEKFLTETKPLMKEMNHGNIVFRGIRLPSRLALKKEIEGPEGKKIEVIESGAALEVRKTLRRKGVKTRSKKEPDNMMKEGNDNRSGTVAGWGAPIIFPAGYCIFKLTNIKKIEAIDCDSGYGKKRQLRGFANLSVKEQKIQKSKIRHLQQMGGVLRKDGLFNHNEIIACLTRFDGAMYRLDPKINHYFNDIAHPLVPILEAIFLQYEYYHQAKIWIPIYEYSGIYNFIIKREFTEEQIIKIWNTVCLTYLEYLEKENVTLLKLLDTPIESILKMSLYRQEVYNKENNFLDPLGNYPDALKRAIHENILEEKNRILKNKKEKLGNHFLQKKTEEFMRLPA